jgi:undecaprenyl diphosphate synthase
VELGIAELTVYAFSTENWSRPDDEVKGLMAMFAELIQSETPELHEEGVQMRFIGRREEVSEELQHQMGWAEETTRQNERMKLFVAFNYGGRAEIVDAARRFESGDEGDFAALLYAPDMSDPDVLVRTSGEERTSNFLLWQCAYSELVFVDVLWPDFGKEHLQGVLDEFAARQRRFGAR